jgi:hypothetical protein
LTRRETAYSISVRRAPQGSHRDLERLTDEELVTLFNGFAKEYAANLTNVDQELNDAELSADEIDEWCGDDDASAPIENGTIVCGAGGKSLPC